MIAGWVGPDARADSVAAALAFQLTPPDWHKRANCRGISPADADRLFFFEAGQPSNEALARCAHCPVQQECADAGEGEAGLWGGLTARERQRGRTAAA